MIAPIIIKVIKPFKACQDIADFLMTQPANDENNKVMRHLNGFYRLGLLIQKDLEELKVA